MTVDRVKRNALVSLQHKVTRVHEGDNVNVHRNMELRNEHFWEVGACEAVFIVLLTAKPSHSSSFKRYDSVVMWTGTGMVSVLVGASLLG
jgi:uncharacterized protein (DUF111 family)